MEEVKRVLSEIKRISSAEDMIVYALKREGTSDRVRGVNVCVIADTTDKTALEREIYLEIESDLAFYVMIYTPDEWENLLLDPQSYASRIAEKGREYGKA